MPVAIKRKPIYFQPDSRRVITQFFVPGDAERVRSIIKKVIDLSEDECNLIFHQVFRQFSNRHRNITRLLENNFNNIKHFCKEMDINCDQLTQETKFVIGAYFTKEYSIESAAFFNPSIVEDPYQGDLPAGHKRVILSFRATGEGHISSIAFRSGLIDNNNDITFEPAGEFIDAPEMVTRHVYDKKLFLEKLHEMKIEKEVIGLVMDQLKDTFIYGELQAAIGKVTAEATLSYTDKKVVKAINWLARSHYEVTFSLDTAISDRVLFPISYAESSGIEDARFVRFTNDDGSVMYYATYTAYAGFSILPKLIQTKDFYHFQVMPMHGEHVQNKGFALFPRKIKDQYAMLSRNDGINNYIMFSDEITLWQNAHQIQQPQYPWEFIQIGNAGSPLETEHGWLVVTHGVGPMRTYSLGATLLDLDNPEKIISQLKTPLLTASEKERDGYVPNVVYSCGAIIHNNELIIPYAMSDYASTIASFSLDEIFDELVPKSKPKGMPPDTRGDILLADDDATLRTLASRTLSQAGYHVSLASDGADALMMIGREHFDLIVSDIDMPNFDGFQLLQILNEKNIQIPVVFMTGYQEPEFRKKSAELGAVYFLQKPFKPGILLEAVETLLQL